MFLHKSNRLPVSGVEYHISFCGISIYFDSYAHDDETDNIILFLGYAPIVFLDDEKSDIFLEKMKEIA